MVSGRSLSGNVDICRRLQASWGHLVSVASDFSCLRILRTCSQLYSMAEQGWLPALLISLVSCRPKAACFLQDIGGLLLMLPA